MATQYVSNSGWIYRYTTEAWSTIRGASTGTGANDGSYYKADAIRVMSSSGRGGTLNYIGRSYFYFDTSGITGTVASATLKIYGYGSYSSADVIAVKSDAFGGDGGTGLVTGDYNNIDFSTPYSSELATWSTSSYNDITLNATALTDIKNNNAFIVSVIEHDYDYSNSAPSVGTNDRNGMYFDPYGGTSRDPYIDYTLATGYGNTVNGVASANIGKINGVGTANISKINGV